MEDGFVESRVALISGSTAGLGLDLAVRLTRAGHSVALNGRSADRVGAAVADVESAVPGAKVVGLPADMTVSTEVDLMVERCKEQLGPVDMFVHAAVVRNEHTLVETTDEVWKENMGACLDGA